MAAPLIAVAARDTGLMAAPGPYTAVGLLRQGTTVEVEICFRAGAWCLLANAEQGRFANGDDLLVLGSNRTVHEHEAERWQKMLDADAKRWKPATEMMPKRTTAAPVPVSKTEPVMVPIVVESIPAGVVDDADVGALSSPPIPRQLPPGLRSSGPNAGTVKSVARAPAGNVVRVGGSASGSIVVVRRPVTSSPSLITLPR